MSKLIHSYALIKSLYEQGEDYIDSFLPFVLKTFPNSIGNSISVNGIQESLKSYFDLEVPVHVIVTILHRAKKRGYIIQSTKLYKLTEIGLEYYCKLEEDKEVEVRINSLIEDIKSYFSRYSILLNNDQIYSLLISFLRKHIEPLVEYLNPKISDNAINLSNLKGNEPYLVQYIRDIEYKGTGNYNTFKDMVFGAIISVVLYVEESSELIEIGSKKFKNCEVLLDTNFIFSILDMRDADICLPAKELLDLLRKNGFKISILSFTLDEIARVVKGFLVESHKYPATVNINSLYSFLKRKGWGKVDAINFISNLDKILNDNGIGIKWISNINLKSYGPSNNEFRDKILKYKPTQDIFSQNHDLAAIDMINNLRKDPVRKIEYSKYLFLTSDGRLSNFNFIEYKHKDDGTVCEVVLDKLLTNILWLKNPGKEPPLKSIIAAYSRDLFINRRIWNKFYDVLEQVDNEGKIKDSDISMIFYHSYIESILREFDDKDIDRINREFLLDHIEKAEELYNEMQERYKKESKESKDRDVELIKEKNEKQIKEKERLLLQWYSNELSQKETKKDRILSDRITNIISNLRESATNKGSIYADIAFYFIVAIFIYIGILLLFKIYIYCESKNVTLFLCIVINILSASGMFVFIKFLLVKLNVRIRTLLVGLFFKQSLKDAKLEEKVL